MHIFHSYRNWKFVNQVTVTDDWGGKWTRYLWQGTCKVCGRPKIRRQNSR